jgi:D-alanine transaminase/branched-chain amino acid aminotransferase
VVIDQELVAKEDAKISIYDLGVCRGYGIFDFFKTVQNQPVWFDDHLDRFYYSAAEMFMEIPLERASLKKLIKQLMDKNNLPDSGIRISLTGGYSEDGYSYIRPNLMISQEPFTYNKENFEKGTHLVTYEHQRQLPHIKTIDYLQAIRLQQYVKERGAQDLLYYNQSAVLECPRCNFFMVNEQDEIVTPLNNILKGITRKKILQMTGFKIKEKIINRDELVTAKEAFVTSTTKCILPVFNIDGRDIGNRKPGSITREIWQRLMLMQEH